MTTLIPIEGTDVPVMTWQGQRVVTLDMVDRVHQRPNGTARRNFNQHRHRLVEAEDYFELDQADEIRRLGVVRPQGGTPEKIVLLTETGYLMVVKSFKDDLAWAIQRRLVSVYFARGDLTAENARLAAQLDHCQRHLRVFAPKWSKMIELERLGCSPAMIAKRCNLSGIQHDEERAAMANCGLVPSERWAVRDAMPTEADTIRRLRLQVAALEGALEATGRELASLEQADA